MHRGVELPEHILPTRIFGLDSLVLQAGVVNTFRACKTSKILLIHKHFFMEALKTHLQDAGRVMTTLKAVKIVIEIFSFSVYNALVETEC